VSEEFVGAAALASRYVVGLVLLIAAIPKLGNQREFARAIRNYGLLSPGLIRPVAAWLPRVELVLALTLLLGVAVTAASATAGALLVAFVVALGVNLARGRSFDCGCGGSIAPKTIGWQVVAGDLALVGMTTLVMLADPGVLTLVGSETSTALSSEDGVAIAMFAATLVLGRLTVSSWLDVRRQVVR
jgi:hypothetical protein